MGCESRISARDSMNCVKCGQRLAVSNNTGLCDSCTRPPADAYICDRCNGVIVVTYAEHSLYCKDTGLHDNDIDEWFENLK